MDTFIIIYNEESDFIRAETEHPEALIADLIKEGYAVNDMEIYRAKELGIEAVVGTVEVKLNG